MATSHKLQEKQRLRDGPTKVRVKLILGGLVVEVEDDSNSCRCITSLAQGETIHRRCLCLCPGPLGHRQQSHPHPEPQRQKTYLRNISIRVGSRIPVNFHNHSLDELREFWEGEPVFRALARKLRHFQNRKTPWLSQHPPLKLYPQS